MDGGLRLSRPAWGRVGTSAAVPCATLPLCTARAYLTKAMTKRHVKELIRYTREIQRARITQHGHREPKIDRASATSYQYHRAPLAYRSLSVHSPSPCLLTLLASSSSLPRPSCGYARLTHRHGLRHGDTFSCTLGASPLSAEWSTTTCALSRRVSSGVQRTHPSAQTGNAPRRGPSTFDGSGASPRPRTPTQFRSSKHCFSRETVLSSAARTATRGS